jgi:hypothetical protein
MASSKIAWLRLLHNRSKVSVSSGEAEKEKALLFPAEREAWMPSWKYTPWTDAWF